MKHIAFDIVDDSRVESDETLVISLVSATSGARIGAVREHSYTILNNDMNITPVDTPSVAFGTAPTSGAETADTITVPVVLSSPAPWTIEVAVVNSGTATAGSDYTYAPHTAVFDSGDSVVNVSVIIIDDTLCETGAETLTLGLVTTGQPVKGGSPSSYSYTIDANDSEYCGRNIYYVRNHGRPYNVDKAAQDSLTAWGYTVTEINDKEIGNYDYSQVAAIFISQSVTSSISALRDKGVPIVCAGSPGHVELGLATASDTGRSLSTSVVVVAAGIPSHPVGDSIQVTNGQRLLPWIRPTSSGTVVAHVADAQGSTPPMHAGVAIFSSGAALAGGGNASAARAMITMAGGGLTLDNQNAYAAGWWEILNSAMEWARRQ